MITSPFLLDAAIAEARERVAVARTVNLNDDLAVIRSHAALAATLERVLWNLTPDDDPDVAAQVDAEDGVSRPVYVRYNRPQVVAA